MLGREHSKIEEKMMIILDSNLSSKESCRRRRVPEGVQAHTRVDLGVWSSTENVGQTLHHT